MKPPIALREAWSWFVEIATPRSSLAERKPLLATVRPAGAAKCRLRVRVSGENGYVEHLIVPRTGTGAYVGGDPINENSAARQRPRRAGLIRTGCARPFCPSPRSVNLDRARADLQIIRDRLIGQPGEQAFQDLPLARREQDELGSCCNLFWVFFI